MAKSFANSLDTQIFEDVISRGTLEQRRELANQLSDLLCDEDAPHEDQEAAVPAVIKLALDPVRNIREKLAERLSNCPTLHPDVAFTIIADDDEIALEFLARSPALDSWRLLAVLKVGDVHRQQVIAFRANLDADVVTHIADAADLPAVIALLDNETVHLAAGDCRRLYVRFGSEPQVVDRLLDRPDLPLEIRMLEAARTSSRLKGFFEDTQILDHERGARAANESEERTFLALMCSASDKELRRVVPFMSGRDMLTASLILRAACQGHLRVVEYALAYLASMPAERVRGLIYGHGSLSLRAVHNKAGLPASCFHLLRAVFDVARAHGRDSDHEPDIFGRKVIETLMTSYDMLTIQDKLGLLGLISDLAGGKPAAIADRLILDLKAAA